MKQSIFNNLGKETLQDMVFTLYELGFSKSYILELLAGNSSEKVNQFLAVAQKINPHLQQEEHCYQNRICYLAQLCVKSESETMMRDEKILKDFLWELLGFRDLKDYITGLIFATYINTRENHEKYFDVKRFITEYLTYIYQQSILDCPEWKYGFPSCIGELRTQMARFIVQTKDLKPSVAKLDVLDEVLANRANICAIFPLEQLG